MQIAFGRVRRKTAPTGYGVKTGPKNGKLNIPTWQLGITAILS